jgi:tetratricopeptide (TPR) repeat protein
MMRIRGRNQSKKLASAIEQGHRLIAAGREQEAYEFLEKGIQEFPDDPEIRLLWGTTLLGVRPQDAAPGIVRAIELGPDEPGRLTRAAGILFKIGQIDTARSYASRAKELAPPDFLLMAYLLNLDSHFAALEGKDELAEAGFRRAIEQEPNSATFVVDLAQFLAERGRRVEALEIVEEALTRAKRKEPLERCRSELLRGSAPPEEQT